MLGPRSVVLQPLKASSALRRFVATFLAHVIPRAAAFGEPTRYRFLLRNAVKRPSMAFTSEPLSGT